ncbi:MAG: hypothetical protein AB1414_19410 [bacterium]
MSDARIQAKLGLILGLIVSLIVLLLSYCGVFEPFELKSLDYRFRLFCLNKPLDLQIKLILRAYPKSPAALKVIQAQAK